MDGKPRQQPFTCGKRVAAAVNEVTVCPWALHQGILLRRLESRADWQHQAGRLPIPPPRPAVPTAEPAAGAVVPIARLRSNRARKI
jgi:hypothetical protein